MTDTQTTVLVAERDDSARTFLLDNLAADGYAALGAQTDQEARVKLAGHSPTLLVAGDVDEEHATLALLRAIRAGEIGGDPALPVIVIGDDAGELELVRAFEAGCDHFMRRPFSYVELRARIGGCVRRVREWRLPRRLVVGSLVIDRDARRVFNAGHEVWLSRREFDLLAHLAAEPTRVFGKEELLREVWGYQAQGRTRTLDAHACRLRKKLGLAGAPDLVQNTRGVGYRLSLGPVQSVAASATAATPEAQAA